MGKGESAEKVVGGSSSAGSCGFCRRTRSAISSSVRSSFAALRSPTRVRRIRGSLSRRWARELSRDVEVLDLPDTRPTGLDKVDD